MATPLKAQIWRIGTTMAAQWHHITENSSTSTVLRLIEIIGWETEVNLPY